MDWQEQVNKRAKQQRDCYHERSGDGVECWKCHAIMPFENSGPVHPIFEIRRVVVVVHGANLSKEDCRAVAFTDALGNEKLEEVAKMHVDSGGRVVYDGPPNVGCK